MATKIILATCNSPLPEGCPQGGVFDGAGFNDIELHNWILEHSPTNWLFEQDHFRNITFEESPPHNWSLLFTPEITTDYYIINGTLIPYQPITKLPYQLYLKQKARELRKAGNLSEVVFWMQVTKKGFHKIDVDRQRVIGNYIVDFYVKKLGLVIEIDGSSHIGKEVYDKKREDYLTSLGLRVYRIKDRDVLNGLTGVIKMLEAYIVENYGLGN